MAGSIRCKSFRQQSPEEQKKGMFDYSRPDLPGSFFWHFIDRMVKDGKMKWTTAYRGVSFVRDPNLSIIHSNEPDQVLVLDPRIIKIVDVGENKRPVTAGEGSDSLAQWMHVLLSIIKQIRGEFGGDLAWNKKRPTLSFSKGWGKFTLSVPERSSYFGEVGLSLTFSYGRAYNSMFIDYKALLNSGIEQIAAQIRDKVERIAARKSDLLFKPIIAIDDAKRLMIDQMADHLGMSIKTRISNSESQERRYNAVDLHGEVQREIDRVLIKTACFLDLKEQEIGGSCNLWVGKHHLISAPSSHEEDFTEPMPMFASMARKARENLDVMIRSFAPKAEGRMYDRNPRFGSEDTVTAFVGWLIKNSGLSLGGALAQEFAAEIAVFEAYPEKRALLSDIAYIMNTKW